jgi:sterol desaturase/sphingolipid hydroxylase (fatty acid hydroxylase superfamily)
MSRIETITTATLLLWMAFMSVLERLFPYTKNAKFFRDGWWLDFFWYSLVQSYFLKILIFNYIIAPAKSALGLAESGYLSNWPIWGLVLLFLFTHDLYIYWFHRLQHTSKFFWRTHEAHHSVNTVDWLAGSRSHAFEIIINQTIEFAPIFFLLDVKTAAIVVPVKALLDATWGMWIHANVNAKTGKLQYIINGPEMHQWHHSNHPEVFYKNYATKFAFWDWLFGTAFLPGLKPFKYEFLKPQRFGLPYDYPRDYFMQHWFAVKRFDVKKVESAPGVAPYIEWKRELLNWLREAYHSITSQTNAAK